MQKRLMGIGLAAVLCAVLCPRAPAAEPVAIETCETLRWEGEPAPVAAAYRPLLGDERPAVRLPTRKGKPSRWSRAAELDLAEMETVALQVAAPRPLRGRLEVGSGAGAYTAEFELSAGEQVVLLPLGVFARGEGAVGWEHVTGLALTLHPDRAAPAVHLLGVTALPAGVAVPGEGLYLLRPFVARVNSYGMAWPIYAILCETEYPPRAEQAPSFLASTLARMYGVQIPVNPEGVTAGTASANVVLLGREVGLASGRVTEAELDEQGYSGYVIRADDGAVLIAGQSRHGTYDGVSRFLEKQGCRFYWRGFHVVPENRQPALRACAIADKPFFPGNRIGQRLGVKGTCIDAENQGLFDVDWAWPEHTAGYLVPKFLYHDDHPDYYAMRGDGTRMPGETGDFRVVICTTHPDVLRISAERMLRWIELQKDRKFFSCTQGDDHEWCRCPRCRAMEYEPGNYSDMMLHWVNHVAREVARKHPDKILTTYAYGPTQRAPVRLKPEPNVHVYYCAWPNASSAPCGIRDFDAPENTLARTEIEAWLKVAPGRVGLYDYNAWGRWTLNGMAWKVKWGARRGLCGFHYCGINKSFEPLFDFVHTRLNWNPFLEVSNLKHEFIYAFYGDAAPEMDRVINGIYDRIEFGDYDSRMHGVPPAEFFTKPFVEEMLALFDKAAARLEQEGNRAAFNDVVSSRGYFVNNCLSVTRPVRRTCTDEELEVFGLCLTRYLNTWLADHRAAVAKAGKEDTKIPGYESVAGTLWAWARVRVETDVPPDQVPPMLARLMEDPVQTIRRNRVTEFVETIEDGWRVPADAFSGAEGPSYYAWLCPGKVAVWVRGTMTDLSRMHATFALNEDPPDGPGVLDIDGQDSDKMWCPPAPIQILANGRKLFDGPNPFVKRGWSRAEFPFPAGTFRKGENVIEIRGMANSDSLFAHWCMLSEVLIRYPQK